jgi:hypothetical protein
MLELHSEMFHDALALETEGQDEAATMLEAIDFWK